MPSHRALRCLRRSTGTRSIGPVAIGPVASSSSCRHLSTTPVETAPTPIAPHTPRESGSATVAPAAVQTRHGPLPEEMRGYVPPNIWAKTNARLHVTTCHPLDTLRRAIHDFMQMSHPADTFTSLNDLSPIVTTKDSFDDLLVPPHHPSRQAADTYYVSHDILLRPHMTAHDGALLRRGVAAAMTCGDVYRRDTIDRTHYPVFHQIDAYRLYPSHHPRDAIVQDLRATLEGLARTLFGKEAKLRWVDAYFPFTTPSQELEVLWRGDWLEVLGCGLLHRDVLARASISGDVDGWAFGLGLERLAMVLFDVPDIRLFWSSDDRFRRQFADGDLRQRFKPFSAYPAVEKHISFWLRDEATFHHNDLCQVVRSVGADLVENVACIDRFEKDGRVSLCFSVVFRSLERNLTHTEVNEIYDQLRETVSTKLDVTMR